MLNWGILNFIITRMTTSISSEALLNNVKDIWKMKVEKISKSTKKALGNKQSNC